jgi:hypothetical protein
MTAGSKQASLLEFLLARPISEERAKALDATFVVAICALRIALGGRIGNKSIRGRNELAVSELVVHVTPAD